MAPRGSQPIHQGGSVENKLILVCLVCLVIEQAIAIWTHAKIHDVNNKTLHRNLKLAYEDNEHLTKRTFELELTLEHQDVTLRKIQASGGLDSAFLFTAGGVKVLPHGWQKHFEGLWAKDEVQP